MGAPEDTTSEELAACMNAAGRDLYEGLLYQACLWNTTGSKGAFSNTDCKTTAARPLPSGELEAGQRLLQEGHDFAMKLISADEKTAKGAQAELKKKLEELRVQAIAFVRRTRGQYSLVSQGGVSLGSWQAGYVYYLSEVLKARRDDLNEPLSGKDERLPAFKTLTGASAGAINAFAAGVESCRASRKDRTGKRELTPQGSLFYQVWVEKLDLLGKDGLFPKDGTLSADKCPDETAEDAKRTAEFGVFSKTPLCKAVELAKSTLETSDQEEGCSFNYGLSLTHLQSVSEPVFTQANGAALEDRRVLIDAKRLTEYVALKVTPAKPSTSNQQPDGNPSGRKEPFKRFTNLGAEQSQRKLQPILLKEDSSGIPLGSVLESVRASGAFPVAFPPVHLVYQTRDPGGVIEDQEADFVDGGTLDNTPVALAGTMNDWTLEKPPNPWLTDLLPRPDSYFLVNPNVVSWEKDKSAIREEKRKADEQELLGKYLGFARELLTAGTEAQLVNAARQLDWLGNGESEIGARAEVPRRNLPIAGTQFAHFMAFLEKDFRVFDFYVGVMDAIEHLKGIEELQGYAAALAPRLSTPEDSPHAKRIKCLGDYYRDRKPTVPRPEKLVLLAGKTTSKSDRTAPADGKSVFSPPPSCEDKDLKNFRAMLVAMHNFKVWYINPKQRYALTPIDESDDEYNPNSEFDQFFRELEIAGYEFTNTEFKDNPRLQFRNMVQRATNVLKSKHSGALTDFAIDTTTRLAADSELTRTFPDSYWSLGYALNGLELGYGNTVWNTNKDSIRLDGRLRIYRLGTKRITDSETTFGGETSLYVGATYSDDLLTPLWFDLPPGALDWELSAGVVGDALMLPQQGDAWLAVLRPGVSAALGLVALQRLYLKLDAEFYPANPGRFLWMNEDYHETVLSDDINRNWWRTNFAVGLRFLP